MKSGTGAVKVTPAQNPHDYKVGLRHNLQLVNILNDDGSLNEEAGERFKVRIVTGTWRYHQMLRSGSSQGMKRFHARVAVVQALKDMGLYIGSEDCPMQIPICKYVAVNHYR